MPSPSSRSVMSVGLGLRQRADPGMHLAEVEADSVGKASPAADQLQADLLGVADLGHHLGGGDQGLGRHHVGQHGRAAEPSPFDERHLAAQLPGHKGRLVAAGAATDDHHVRHAGILARRAARPVSVLPPGSQVVP